MIFRETLCYLSRSGLVALLVLPAVLWGTPQPAEANPLPEGAILTHVQPVDPDFCNQCPITACDQIVQYTEETGILEFDLFVYPPGYEPDLTISRLEGLVEWPPQWQFIDYELCEGGQGTILVNGNQAQLDIAWPACPQMNGEVFLVARFIVDVTGYGSLGISELGAAVDLHCPPDEYEMWAVGAVARAGVECSYCYTPCDLGWPCEPHLSPGVLELEVTEGESVRGQIHVYITGSDPDFPCGPNFVATESWAALDVEWTDWNLCEIEVTADASALDRGIYEGWVRGEGDCVGCTRVVLTVLPGAQGVWDDDREAGEPQDPGTAVSWGRLKTLYR
jgi:hypothetical protein